MRGVKKNPKLISLLSREHFDSISIQSVFINKKIIVKKICGREDWSQKWKSPQSKKKEFPTDLEKSSQEKTGEKISKNTHTHAHAHKDTKTQTLLK